MAETRYADNDGVRIAYEVRGEGDPLLLVHGLGYARWGWETVIDDLSDRYRVIAFDNRGIGDSDVPDGPYTAAEMATDAVAVLDAAAIDRAHVIGTSLGGMIAQELAIDHPERVHQLVLVASHPGGESGYPLPEQTQELIAEMPQMEPAEALRRATRNALSDGALDEQPELVDRILEHRLGDPQEPAGWQAQAAAGSGYESGGRLTEIQAPALVVQGDEDVVVDTRNAEVIADAIPDARLEWLRGAGHLAFWEQPDRFVRLVDDFLG